MGKYRLQIKPNTWTWQTFKIKSITECLLGCRWHTRLDWLRIVIYINFGSTQLPFSFKKQLLVPLLWQINITNLVANVLTYSSNAFLGLFCWGFLLPWRHLLLSLILWLLKTSFYVSEAAIERCCVIYSLEVKAKPATGDKSCFIINVGRGLHPSLLSPELS